MTCLNTTNITRLNNLIQDDSLFYIFEIEIKETNKHIKIRRIKNLKEDYIIYGRDKIPKNINKIKFNIFDINDPLNILTIKKKFNNIIDKVIFLNYKNIILQIYCENDYIMCKYKFIESDI